MPLRWSPCFCVVVVVVHPLPVPGTHIKTVTVHGVTRAQISFPVRALMEGEQNGRILTFDILQEIEFTAVIFLFSILNNCPKIGKWARSIFRFSFFNFLVKNRIERNIRAVNITFDTSARNWVYKVIFQFSILNNCPKIGKWAVWRFSIVQSGQENDWTQGTRIEIALFKTWGKRNSSFGDFGKEK